jgi:hypothetical protein
MAIFSISEFKAGVGQLLKPNLFEANISGPSGIGTISNFKFRCEKAEFPGKTLATVDDPGGGGPTLKLPYDVTYNDITLSIICSADLAERKYFENWIDLIVGKANNNKAGLVNYYNVYAKGKTLTVKQLDEAGTTKGTWTMQHVYPIAITPMNAVWDELNTYQRFEVTLTYRYYEIS